MISDSDSEHEITRPKKFSSIRDPNFVMRFKASPKMSLKMIDIENPRKFKTSRVFKHYECHIKECSFELNELTTDEIKKRSSEIHQQKQLFHFITKAYLSYNKYCIIYNRKWSKRNKNNETLWTSNAYCKYHPICALYRFQCRENDGKYFVDVFKNKDQVHPKGVQLTRQLRDAEREIMKSELKHRRACMVAVDCHKQINKNAAKGGRIDSFSEDVIRKTKSEDTCGMRYDPDMYKDLSALAANEGYITDVKIEPFSIQSHDRRVASMVKNNEFGDTVHIDGTGQLVRNKLARKQVLIYDVIGSHKSSGKKCPLSHLTSASHRGIDFSIWLQQFVYFFMSEARCDISKHIKRFVTDMSWALIFGIVNGVNCFKTVKVYIENCFEVLVNNRALTFVIVQICYAHFMKIVSRFIKKHTNDVAKQNYFMDAMRTGAKISDLKKFEEWFRCVITVFSSEHQTDEVKCCCENLFVLWKEASSIKDDENTSKWQEHKEKEYPDFEEDPEEDVSSTFSERFMGILEHVENQIANQERSLPNVYFIREDFGKLFFNKFIKSVPFPLWTNLLGHFCEEKKPVSNASIESWFKNLKHYIVGRQRDMVPAQFMRLRQSYMDGLLKRISNVPGKMYSTTKALSNPDNAEDAASSVETWSHIYKPKVNKKQTKFAMR